MALSRIYKHDAFGTIGSAGVGDGRDGCIVVVRDTTTANRWSRGVARHLARRESAALELLGYLDGMPALLAFDGTVLRRTHIRGAPMYTAEPRSSAYFQQALRLLRRMHTRGVAHNDLAKEANWLCTPAGRPAIVDFQLAYVSKRRSKLFRLLAREDLRHLLKHKRSYVPERLTRRQRELLAAPALPSRLWRRVVKPPYLWLTRRVLGWPERDGPRERGIATS